MEPMDTEPTLHLDNESELPHIITLLAATAGDDQGARGAEAANIPHEHARSSGKKDSDVGSRCPDPYYEYSSPQCPAGQARFR